ncbi:MAG TPA: hypothetical protein VK428_03050 [Acidimicrobiales bacterium]|nr:hypothetical protein [Acidimicrobiales bacterium]
MPTALKQVVSLEDAKRALSEALGPGYKMSTKSDSSFTVHRSGLLGVRVTMTWADGATTFRVRPEGAILVLLFNAVYTAPKVRSALVRAFPQGR